MAWRTVVLVGLSACQLNFEVDGRSGISCAQDRDCPHGYSCQGELSLCYPAGIDPPQLSVTFITPVDHAQNVSTSTQIVVAFSAPVALDSAMSRVHLRGQEGDVGLSLALPPDTQDTLVATLDSELLPTAVYTFTVDAGLQSSVSALPSTVASSVTFVTAERRDQVPPGPVSSILIDHVSDARANLSWKKPSDSDWAGVLVLRKHGAPLLATELPTQGVSYAVGAFIGDAEVAGVVSAESMSSVDLLPGFYDWSFFALDKATNYSTATRTPFVTQTHLTWCPSESGTFSLDSVDTGTQGLILGTGDAVSVSPLGATQSFAPPIVATGVTYALRFSAKGSDGEYRSVPVPFTASAADMGPLTQPVAAGASLGVGGAAVFAFGRYAWPQVEASVDNDPVAGEEMWVDLPMPTGAQAATSMPFAGAFRLRVRPVVGPQCANAAWVESDEFMVGLGARYVSAASGNDSNDGASRVTPYATLERALAASTGTTALDIYVSEGQYYPHTGAPSGDALMMKSQVRIFGGFANDFIRRDGPLLDAQLHELPRSHETVINGSIPEVVWGGPCFAAVVFPPNGVGMLLDNVTVLPAPQNIDSTCGVYIDNNAEVTLSRSRLLSGAANLGRRGYSVQMQCGAPVAITGSVIQPNTQQDAEIGLVAACQTRISDTTITNSLVSAFLGVQIEASDNSGAGHPQPRFFITHNRFVGPASPSGTFSDVIGFYCKDAVAIDVRDNIFAPSVPTYQAVQSTAVNVSNGCFGKVSANLIDGGVNTSQSVGVDLVSVNPIGGAPLLVSNNVVSGGMGKANRWPIRVRLEPGVVPVYVTHNDFFLNSVALGNTQGMFINGGGNGGGRFTNNLFFGVFGGLGVLLQPVGAFGSFQNNGVIPAASFALYDENNSVFYYTPATFETAMCGHGSYEYEIPTTGTFAVSGPLASLFVSAGGADGLVETLEDNDWHLLPAVAPAFAQGLDTTQPLCGGNFGTATACTAATGFSCGAVTGDRDGKPRPATPTVGAYEP